MGMERYSSRLRFAALVILLAAFVYLLFLIAPLVWAVIQIAIIVLFVCLALDPFVHFLVSFGSPRWAAVLLTILVLVLLFGLLIWFLIPPLVAQVEQFINDLPGFWAEFVRWFNAVTTRIPSLSGQIDTSQLPYQVLAGVRSFGSLVRTIFTTTVGLVAAVILITVTTIYALLNPWPLLLGLRGLFPKDWWSTIDHTAGTIAQKIQWWVIGTIALGIFIGALDYIGLLIINIIFEPDIPFIFLFAVIGGVLEFVPVIGPLLAGAIPTLVALAIDPSMALAVVLAYVVIQQIENHIAVPLIMHKAVNLHPVTLIFALIIMTGLFGIFGALIAVPTASTVKVLYDDWYYPLTHHGERPIPSPTVREASIQARQRMRARWDAWSRKRRHDAGDEENTAT